MRPRPLRRGRKRLGRGRREGRPRKGREWRRGSRSAGIRPFLFFSFLFLVQVRLFFSFVWWQLGVGYRVAPV